MKITPIPHEPLTNAEAEALQKFMQTQSQHIYEKYGYDTGPILYRGQMFPRKMLAKILMKAQ